MKVMTCELRPDLYNPVIDDVTVPGYPVIEDETPADAQFAEEVNQTWHQIQADLTRAVGPALEEEYSPVSLKKFDIRSACSAVVETPGIGSKLLLTGGFVVAKTFEAFQSQASLERDYQQRLRVFFGNQTDVAYRTLLNTLVQGAIDEGGQIATSAEDWADLCIERLDSDDYFYRTSGIRDSDKAKTVIGHSTVALLEMPRFDNPVKTIGHRKFGAILQAVET